jgi:hypothetical protein
VKDPWKWGADESGNKRLKSWVALVVVDAIPVVRSWSRGNPPLLGYAVARRRGTIGSLEAPTIRVNR